MNSFPKAQLFQLTPDGKYKSVRICKCRHTKNVHQHHREGTDCSLCFCTVHPQLTLGPTKTSACLLYPEECCGLCPRFRDERSMLRQIVDFFLRR